MCNSETKSTIKPKRQRLICPICGNKMIKKINEIDKRFAFQYGDILICNVCFLDMVKTYNNNIIQHREKENKNNINQELSQEYVKDVDFEEVILSVKSIIKGQDGQIEEIGTAIFKNFISDDVETKSNIILLGPSGNGKTQIVKLFANSIGVPWVVEDATRYTKAGYRGSSVDAMIMNLYKAAKGDAALTERGIIIIDEGDKKRPSGGNELDVGGEAVLDSLLKIAEGTVVPLTDAQDIVHGYIDTSLITIVFVGAFPDLIKIHEKRIKGIRIGFDIKSNKEEIDKGFTLSDFENYGFKSEFVGRFDTVVVINKLSYENYVDILENSEKSILLSYVTLLSQNGISVSFEQEVINEIAKRAVELDIGARGLKKVVRKLFNRIIYKFMLGEKEYTRCVITKETLVDENKFILE